MRTDRTTPDGALARAVEVVAPARLGTSFRWLTASSWTSNLGDGIIIAAGPLLVASQTDQAFLVALAALLQWLPPLLLGLVAGAVTDRVDRRRLVVAVDSARVAVLGVLVASIALDAVSIAVVLVAFFVLGTAETFADNATSTILPMLVERDDLALGNARIGTGVITLNQLAGPPLGAALFAAGSVWPFATQAVCVALAVALVSRVRLPPHGRRHREGGSDAAHPPPRMRHDVVEALRWVRHHAAVRTLVLTIFVFNVTFGAAWSVLVLYATQRLGLGEVGFGLVTTVMGAGGIVGTLSYGAITRRVSLGNLMRVGLVIETLTHLGLALTTSPVVAMPIFFLFGVHAFVWGTTSITVRQRAVPSELQGRVGSVNLLGVFGGLVIGAGLGGVLAQLGGVVAPFWFAFVGSAVFLVLIWPQLSHVAHQDEQVPGPGGAAR